jgi:hypothetical protein
VNANSVKFELGSDSNLKQSEVSQAMAAPLEQARIRLDAAGHRASG